MLIITRCSKAGVQAPRQRPYVWRGLLRNPKAGDSKTKDQSPNRPLFRGEPLLARKDCARSVSLLLLTEFCSLSSPTFSQTPSTAIMTSLISQWMWSLIEPTFMLKSAIYRMAIPLHALGQLLLQQVTKTAKLT